MTIEATYRDGAFYPVHPINLPENTRVEVSVPAQLSREEIIAMRPKAPKITVEEFEAIIKKNSLSAPSLPVDFSREDIYSEHN
jgi:predicted DNA-binding antitoxin AbrB/MazE fold protein